MTKAARKRLLRADRGHRYRMVLELQKSDDGALEKLVERYQTLLGGALKCNKAFVIRQLIRHAALVERLPPIRE